MKDGLPETPSIGTWLNKNLPELSVVGIDASLYEEEDFVNLEKGLGRSKQSLYYVRDNLVDLIWNETRSKFSLSPLVVLDKEHVGMSMSEKLSCIRTSLSAKDTYACLFTSLDEIAWLLNMRGSDIPFNMVFFSYCLVTQSSLKLFIHLARLDKVVKEYLLNEEPEIELYDYDEFFSIYKEFCNKFINETNKIWLCPRSSHAIHAVPKENSIFKDLSQVAKLKIIKNNNEIVSSKMAHIKDSVTLCEFFYWLNKNINSNTNDELLNEYYLACKIDQLRATKKGFSKPSFETICSVGANGAIIHYKPNESDSTPIESNSLLLLDSGGHYFDCGTTDVTRTVWLGDKDLIPQSIKNNYTYVLKGHIQLALRVFPNNIRPELLDSFARQALWEHGLDYRHGTGHGVGMLLGVHEIPIIGTRKHTDIGVQENMIITIEPGYYEENSYGIRLENCNLVIKANTENSFCGIKFLTFEPLTLVPFQQELINRDLLNTQEVKWLNDYHEKVFKIIGSELKSIGNHDVHEWLKQQTQKLI